MFAIMMGISAIAPAMADRATAPGHNRIDICHFDDEEIQYVLISIPEKAVRAHEKNHDMDIIPAPEDGCPVIEPEPSKTRMQGVRWLVLSLKPTSGIKSFDIVTILFY